jgi:hypothetical protein
MKLVLFALSLWPIWWISGWAVYYGPSWNWTDIAAHYGVQLGRVHGAAPVGWDNDWHENMVPVAVPDCAAIGKHGTLTIGTGQYPIVVVDCADPDNGDRERIEAQGIIIEVPYYLAAGWHDEGKRRAWIRW